MSSRILFGAGAVGQIVHNLQSALTMAGFDTRGTDGWYGVNTCAAVRQFQSAKNLVVTGAVDLDTWQLLMGCPPPTAGERSLQLTANFESHGFGLAVGNFDGALLTWGIIGFTMISGEVQAILLAINQRAPNLIQQAFQEQAATIVAIMTSPRDEQERWANSVTLPNGTLAQPLRSMFSTFGSFPEVQAEQLNHVDKDYLQPAIQTARRLAFTSELGLALCFDIHVQNGGIKSAAMAQVRQQMTPTTTEADLRKMVANAVADWANPKWREDVRSRKLTIATGQGAVHGHNYVLSAWGLSAAEPAAELAQAATGANL